jgi:putative intracellular protease/amidase
MNKLTKVLMVLTSHGTMGDSGAPTGAWFEELATPYFTFTDAGAEVDIASIRGGIVPFDPHSKGARGENSQGVERFLDDASAVAALQHSLAIHGVSAKGYDIIFMPGGHGTMWDFPKNIDLAQLVKDVWESRGIVAAVCHGPAGLMNVKDSSGRMLVEDRRVSAFTDSEERASRLDQVVPFLLETRLRALGARFEGGPDFEPYAVRDGQLVTGQNPASSVAVAHLALEAARRPVG